MDAILKRLTNPSRDGVVFVCRDGEDHLLCLLLREVYRALANIRQLHSLL
jgi:hypothetical protein